MPAGRPKKHDENKIIEKMLDYIAKTDEPMIQEFCLNNDINRQYLYDMASNNKDLNDTIKKLMEKQEMYLIKNAETGKINPTFAIFRLKQKPFCWTDKQELETKNETKLTVTLDKQLEDWAK